jgi:hypothetical protein
MIALVPGHGVSNLNSVTQMRYKADMLRSLPYDSIAFGILSYPITGVEVNHFPAYPTNYELIQNYPNPFNPVTKISYTLPSESMVELKVYNILGQRVTILVSEKKPAGFYEVDLNAADLPSGVYMYRIQAGNFVETKKMLLVR